MHLCRAAAEPGTVSERGMDMALDHYIVLGNSGLRVSRIALGGMTFGKPWVGTWAAGDAGWGMEQADVDAVLASYVEAGGNFIDTSDHYGQGASEDAIGRFMAERKLRDRLVVCTKAGFIGEDGNPNAGGSGRKNLMRSVEGSLRRLKTDYIDLFLLHVWDGLTPVDEIARTLDDLARSGKARHVGLSNVPVSFAARFQTLAGLRALEPAIAMQFEYSLVERTIELEHIPLCRDFGTGVMAYGALASGFLTGKYDRDGDAPSGDGRLGKSSRMFRRDERKWTILDTVRTVAREVGRPPAQVALNWALARPGIGSIVAGVTSVAQLRANLAALDFVIPEPLMASLDSVSEPEPRYPVRFMRDNARIFLGSDVTRL